MPSLTIENPAAQLFPWAFEPSFHVTLGKAEPADSVGARKVMRLGVPRGMAIWGPELRTFRSPLHWESFRDTLVEADRIDIQLGLPIAVQWDFSRLQSTAEAQDVEMSIYVPDHRLAQWMGLFRQAHKRVTLGPSKPGDLININGNWRDDAVTIPLFPGQAVKFLASANTFAGPTVVMDSATTRPGRHSHATV